MVGTWTTLGFEFEVEGDLTQFEPGVRPNSNFSCQTFSVAVRDSQWQIRMPALSTMENLASQAVVEGRTNSSSFPQEVVIGTSNNAEVYAMRTYGNGAAWGYVESNGYPREVDSSARFAWIGLCAHCYQGQPTNLPPLFLELIGPTPEDSPDQQRRAWAKFAEPPHLPYLTVFFGVFRNFRASRTAADWESGSLAPLGREFTNACVRVLETTNLGGLTLPTRWVYEKYHWQSGRVMHRAEAAVRSIRLGTSLAGFVPDLPPSGCPVLDYRFRSANPAVSQVGYWIRDGHWKSADEAREIQKKQDLDRRGPAQVTLRGGTLGR